MANVSWFIPTGVLSLLVMSLVELPVAASYANPVAQAVAQAMPSVVANRPVLKTGSQGAEVSELQAALKLLGYYPGTVDGFYNESTAIAVTRFQQASGLSPDGVTGPATWQRLFPSPTSTRTATSTASTNLSTVPSAATPRPTSSNYPASSFPVPSAIQTTTNNSGVSVNSAPPVQPVQSSSPTRPTRSLTTTTVTNPTVTPQFTTVALPVLKPGMQGSAIAQLQGRLRTLGFYRGRVDGVFGPATQAAVKAAQQSFKLAPDGIVGSATWSALLR